MTTETAQVTNEILDKWATDMTGPVALHMNQKLLSVEGDGGVIFPPTYADIGYNIDILSDGTRVATIDSVGSQANRLEPIFKAAPGDPRDEWLVPQIEIVLRTENCGDCAGCEGKGKCQNPHKEKRSILDLAHRAADAVVQSSPKLGRRVEAAFRALHQKGDAGPLCALVPTSLVFGVWDSRGSTGEKRPRLVRSVIRAWDVEPLHAAAQFNSVAKALDEGYRDELEKEAKLKKVKLSEKGFADAPAVFRKTEKIQKYRDGAPNPDARVLGGVLAKGPIEREVTVNLVALRGLRGKDDMETTHIRKYVLGLTLLAATADIELFLREGCQLRYTDSDDWYQVPRRGEPTPVSLPAAVVRPYTKAGAAHFLPEWRKTWPEDKDLEHTFDIKEAKKLLAKKAEDEEPTEA